MKVQTKRSLAATGWAPCCPRLENQVPQRPPCCRHPGARTEDALSPPWASDSSRDGRPWARPAPKPHLRDRGLYVPSTRAFLRGQVGRPSGVRVPTGLPRRPATRRCPWSARPEKARDRSPRLLTVSPPRDQLSWKEQIHGVTLTKTETRRERSCTGAS